TLSPTDYEALLSAYADLVNGMLAQTAPYAPPRPTTVDANVRQFDGIADRYRIEGRLGGGGMGDVYRAPQLPPQRLVALKMIRPQFVASDAARERFRTEARALAKFDHPHIVRILDSGESTGHPYLAMEFVEGGTLEQAAAGRQWTVDSRAKARRVA